MKGIVLIFIILWFTCVSASKLLTSDDLGWLFVKYATNEINNDEMEVIDNVIKVFRPTWNSNGVQRNKGLQCFLCRGAFIALFSIVHAGFPDIVIIGTANKLCNLAIGLPRVCRGMIKLNYPILKYIIKTTPAAKPSIFCGLLLQSDQEDVCPFHDSRFDWKINLPPKTKKMNKKIPLKNTYLKIALISDAHIDPLYEPLGTTNCKEPTCCRKGQAPKYSYYSSDNDEKINNVTLKIDGEVMLDLDTVAKVSVNTRKLEDKFQPNSAGYWGDYQNCDTPIWAYEDAIERIASHKDIDVVYYLGDNIDHHIWETTYEGIIKVNKLIIDKMILHFGKKINVIPVIGNHESQPVNQFAPPSIQFDGLNTTWLYKSLASQWSYYLSDDAVASVRERGQFSVLLQPGLRVISLNVNIANRFNWWLVFNPLNQKKHLEWLVNELYKAELLGEKVHILSHIPPGDADLTYTWTREYYRVIERFSNTISAQFAGHTHVDDLKLFIDKGTDKAFQISWGAGSTTSYTYVNPNYKIVSFDKNYEPTDIETYIYNLTEANLTPHKRPRWFKLYKTKKIYNLLNLNAPSIDNLTYEMVEDKKYLLDLYMLFWSKNSHASPFCDVDCKLEELCKAVTSVLWEHKRCLLLKKLYQLYFA